MLMHYLLDERSGDSGGYHDLKGLAQKYCDAPEWEADIKQYLPSKATPYSAIPHAVRMTYHAYDCDYTLRLYYELDKLHAQEPKSRHGYPQPIEAANLLYRAANALARVEMHGALIDVAALHTHRTRMEAELDTLQAQVKANIPDGAMYTGPLFSINSPKQISHIMYNVLGLPPYEDPKVSDTSTASKVLRAYEDRHPFIYHLARYREISHLYKVYIKGFEERLDDRARLHTEYNLHGTTTGRLSSRNPNLQNVPRDSIIKQLFVAPPGYVFCNADYKQLEVRVGAYYSHDHQLIADLGKDLHWEVATQVFADFVGRFLGLVQREDIDGLIALADSSTIMTDVAARIHHTPREQLSVQKLHDWIRGRLRFATKFITFGILYGRGAASLADPFNGLGCTLEEAKAFLHAWHKRYPSMSKTMLELETQAETRGWVETPRGRRRRFPLITDVNQWAIKHQAVNMPIQSLASDMTLASLTTLERELPARDLGYVVLTVHDAIAFELKEDRLDEATTLIRDIMENAWPNDIIRFEVDLATGPNWYTCK
jgi:DNA polymerase-1